MVRLLLLSAISVCAVAFPLDLLRDAGTWVGNLDRQGPAITVGASEEAPLWAEVSSNAGAEDYPKLRLTFDPARDLTDFMRLRWRVRVVCKDPSVREKRVAAVFYDDQHRHASLPGNPSVQQVIEHYVPVNRWMDYRDWILTLHRGAIQQVDLYIYEDPLDTAHTYRWEFADLALEGVGEEAVLFDTEIYANSDLRVPAPDGTVAGTVGAGDLSLEFAPDGRIRRVLHSETEAGVAGDAPTGLLLRDATGQAPLAPVGGTFEATEDGLRHHSRVDALGVELDATYRTGEGYIEVQGAVTDLRGEDRAVQVALALPLSGEGWQWWDSAAKSRPVAGERLELSALETGMQYGLNGAHSKYPIGAATIPGRAGVSLGLRMDEPVVHRIACNPALNLLYIVLDFGLIPETAVDGHSLSSAPFRILVYSHDPAWGFRSALDRYYGFFPEFFTRRTDPRREGGWYVWGHMKDTPDALRGGFGFHWGPSGNDAVKWDNENNVYSLLYIEPEFFQQTMGDFDRRPTAEEGLKRLELIASGDEAELEAFAKLGYSHSYTPSNWVAAHSHKEALRTIANAARLSVNFERDLKPAGGSGQYPWMTESRWGIIFPCNLDPDIPEGKGWFNREIYLDWGLRGADDAGARYDGIGLDSFGGYGQDSRANYRREHFKYAQVPLSFSASDYRPVQVAAFASVEWVRDLAAATHADGRLLMANCSWGRTPAWLTFAAPYLDIFGAEATQFADPDYIRAIARTKACTDLPYNPRPDWEVAWHLLHGIYPGHGNEISVMAELAEGLRELSAAGWEPLTHATAEPATVRVERFGSGDRVYLSMHNPTEDAVSMVVRLDRGALGLGDGFQARDLLDDGPVAVETDALRLDLAGKATRTVVLEK